MRAVVYHGPGEKAWEEAPDPTILDDSDAIVRVDAVTICGTDLHILKGDVPAVTDRRILGHEAVGTVEAVGDGVRNVQVGDRVLVSCITACGRCVYCRQGMYGQCLGGGGWILGHRIDGTQPTGYEVGVLNGAVQLGETVVVPVGRWRTSGCTALRRRCTSRTCGSAT